MGSEVLDKGISLLKALSWGIRGGAITPDQARSTVKLFRFGGFFGRPDTESPSSTVREKSSKMAKLKAKTSPESLRGTKAGAVMSGARVKDASERLSTKKFDIKNKHGQPLRWGKQVCQTPSEKELAEIGCWMKRTLLKQGLPGIMSEWETNLLREMVEKGGWVGQYGEVSYNGGQSPDDFMPREVVRKALLDDTVSGGLFLAPVTFDPAVVTIPLLHGELLPEVDLRPASGRRVQSAVVNNVQMNWGTAPGSQLQPFNTSDLVSELATPLFNLQGAIEISNDLLYDSPVNIGSTIVGLFGERQKAELDKIIINGDGVTQPQGIMRAVGLTSVNSDNGLAGPPTVSDYESLLFGIGKEYRQKDWAPCYIGNDTSYRRARGIQVGPGDERRVFGMDHEAYMLLNHPYKIQNDLPNNKVLFGCLRRFRLYSRAGTEVVVERGGRTLALANTSLVVLRSRWGGQVVDGASFAICNDMQS